MASHATIVSSTIPQLPKESILDGSNYLDWELQLLGLGTKFESKTKKCKFLGYSTQSKAYKLWDLESKSLVISRDVHFVESQSDDSRIAPEFTVEIPAPPESPI